MAQNIYNNHFNEFRGETAEDVIQSLYSATHEKTGIAYENWWAYQQDVWAQRYGAKIPESHAPGACAVLLDVLLKVGALEPGPAHKKGKNS